LVILKQQHLNHFMGLQNPFVTICHSEFWYLTRFSSWPLG
jgi:hypothetical protein